MTNSCVVLDNLFVEQFFSLKIFAKKTFSEPQFDSASNVHENYVKEKMHIEVNDMDSQTENNPDIKGKETSKVSDVALLD